VRFCPNADKPLTPARAYGPQHPPGLPVGCRVAAAVTRTLEREHPQVRGQSRPSRGRTYATYLALVHRAVDRLQEVGGEAVFSMQIFRLT
jgi:hypothetical protein